MGGDTYYGRCCNRIIVSRRVRYCGYCGGPLERNTQTGEMERTNQGTYAQLVERSEARALATEDYMAQIEALGQSLRREEEASVVQVEIIMALKTDIRDLEALVALGAQNGSPRAEPRAPDVVVVDSDVPGVSGALASIQEACSVISMRGANKGKPCIRPAEPNQKHATGRHRY